jgi:hypothetical protein
VARALLWPVRVEISPRKKKKKKNKNNFHSDKRSKNIKEKLIHKTIIRNISSSSIIITDLIQLHEPGLVAIGDVEPRERP